MPTKWQKRMFPPSYPQRTLTFDNHQWIKVSAWKSRSLADKFQYSQHLGEIYSQPLTFVLNEKPDLQAAPTKEYS